MRFRGPQALTGQPRNHPLMLGSAEDSAVRCNSWREQPIPPAIRLRRSRDFDLTDLIWKRATMKSFSLFAQSPAAWEKAWNTIVPLLQSGAIKAVVAKTFPLAEAADALRHLVEDRPFGRVVLTI